MALENTQTKVQYLGNGVTREWPVPFPLIESKHVRLALLELSSLRDWPVESGFELLGMDTGDLLVVYPVDPKDAPLAPGYLLTIYRDVPLTQPMDLSDGGSYDPEVVERQADRTTMQIQQLAEHLGRVPKFPVASVDGETDLSVFMDRLTALVVRAEEATRRAEEVADGRVLKEGAENLNATWGGEAVEAGGILDLPVNYFPGRHVLTLSMDGLACYTGSSVSVPEVLQYEEIDTGAELSRQVKLLFDAPAGAVWNAKVVASNLTFLAADTLGEAFELAASLEENVATAKDLGGALLEEVGRTIAAARAEAAGALETAQGLANGALAAATEAIGRAESLLAESSGGFTVFHSPSGIRGGTIAAGSTFTVPQYTVGQGRLRIFVDGLLVAGGSNVATCQYRENGNAGEASTSIVWHWAIDNSHEIVAIV